MPGPGTRGLQGDGRCPRDATRRARKHVAVVRLGPLVEYPSVDPISIVEHTKGESRVAELRRESKLLRDRHIADNA